MTRRAATFEFEGQQLTIAEICERVPALADASIRKHLKAGRNTAQAMLSHVPNRKRGRLISAFNTRKPKA